MSKKKRVIAALAILTSIGVGIVVGAQFASASGPFFPQGNVVDLCIGISGNALDHVYAEEGKDAGIPGSCAANYSQLQTVADPGGYPIGAPGTTSTADVVTVNSVSPDPLDESTSSFTYQMVAASSKGYAISTWNLSGAPSEVTISNTGLITAASVPSGTYDITVTAVDTNGVAGSVEFELVVS